MKHNKKEPIFVSLVSDTTFKYMFKNEKTRDWFIDIIKDKTGIDLKEYHLVDNEMNTGNFLKDYRSDLVLSNNKDCVIIEMNSSYSEAVEIKGRQYLFRKAGNSFASGEKFTNDKKTILIMFNDYKKKKYDKYSIIYSWFGSHELGIKYDDIKMFEIFLPFFHEKCYDEYSEIDKRLWLFSSKSYEEMRNSVKNDSNLYIIEELERLGMNDNFVDEYDREIVNKKMMNSMRSEGEKNGIQIGMQKEKQEIVKNSLKENIDINTISKITGLTVEEIRQINNNI